MSELRKVIRHAKNVISQLQELLQEHNIPSHMEIDDIVRSFVFLDGYVTCMEKQIKTNESTKD